MEEDKIRQKARKLINEKYPYLPFKEWGYFEDMFINGWGQCTDSLILKKLKQDIMEEKTIDSFIKELKRISADKRKLPLVIDCPNGLQVYPKIKMRWNNPVEMMKKQPDKIVITWDQTKTILTFL